MDINLIDLSRPRVRYNGRVLDKCALSGLIHDVGCKAGFVTTWSDIYWYDAKYSELVDKLNFYLSKLS